MTEQPENKSTKTGLSMDAARAKLAEVQAKKKSGKTSEEDSEARETARAKEKAEKLEAKRQLLQGDADEMALEEKINAEAYAPDLLKGVQEVLQNKVLNTLLVSEGWAEEDVLPGTLLMETLKCLSKENPKTAVAVLSEIACNAELISKLKSLKPKFVGKVEEVNGKLKPTVELTFAN
jgi:hypothetical protein